MRKPIRDKYTLSETVQFATRGDKNAPLHRPLLNQIVEDARCGRILLISECATNMALSAVSRTSAIAWLRALGATLPPELLEVASLEEAIAIIAEHAAKLTALEARLARLEGPAPK